MHKHRLFWFLAGASAATATCAKLVGWAQRNGYLTLREQRDDVIALDDRLKPSRVREIS